MSNRWGTRQWSGSRVAGYGQGPRARPTAKGPMYAPGRRYLYSPTLERSRARPTDGIASDTSRACNRGRFERLCIGLRAAISTVVVEVATQFDADKSGTLGSESFGVNPLRVI